MSKPNYLVRVRACPNQLIWSLEYIRCPKFGRGSADHLVLAVQEVPVHAGFAAAIKFSHQKLVRNTK
jgi:hypothetical protein